MSVVLESFAQKPYRGTAEWRRVESVASSLLQKLNGKETLRLIEQANRPGASSRQVQDAFRPAAESLGFHPERKGLFSASIPGLRPDYFLPLADGGIILEVERGKTTTNNMDLLDFWKCHICGAASYLFLLVPQELRHNPRMSPKREYAAVKRRLAQFFEPDNYTNVRGLCLFGY